MIFLSKFDQKTDKKCPFFFEGGRGGYTAIACLPFKSLGKRGQEEYGNALGGIRQCLGRNTARPWEEYGKASGGIRQPTQKCIFSCYFLGWVDMGKDGVGKLGGS